MFIRTGHTCKLAGFYVSECVHEAEIEIRCGEQFPRCPIGNESVRWRFIRHIDGT